MEQMIDPVEFGKLIEAMRATREESESLRHEMSKNREELAQVTKRLERVEAKFVLGKGALIGLVCGLGFAVEGFRSFLVKVVGGMS